jgi:hypothetical protein
VGIDPALVRNGHNSSVMGPSTLTPRPRSQLAEPRHRLRMVRADAGGARRVPAFVDWITELGFFFWEIRTDSTLRPVP